ncbi:hypothetical protein WISP_76382 [Willisornis vidua]|uniref:Reverse transcriptase domain-containing protein n=1 Tax=Willisornis vidua TaxID=1566151 RepID=A0ABQ9DB74_9PASS|nr:hypothetical protein WISP_76382 [Willisornis vidua]
MYKNIYTCIDIKKEKMLHVKREHRELGVVFVHIVKAFDTMSHQHILMGLQQKGEDPNITNLIRNMYENIYTHISSKNRKIDQIKMQFKPTKDSYSINDCLAWAVNSTPLNMIDPGSSEKFLGLQIDPWISTATPELSEQLGHCLRWLNRALLKPFQKVDILKTFSIPKITSLAHHMDIKAAFLDSLDTDLINCQGMVVPSIEHL